MTNKEHEVVVKFRASDAGLANAIKQSEDMIGRLGVKAKISTTEAGAAAQKASGFFDILFNKTMSEGANVVGGLSGRFGALTAAIGPAGFAAAAAGGAFAVFFSHVTNAAESVRKMADEAETLGISLTSLASIQFASIQSGGGVDGMQQALGALSQKIGDVLRGVEGARKPFDEFGISITNAKGEVRELNDIFRDIADRFRGGALGAKEFSIASEFFGKSSKQIIQQLRGMSDAMLEADSMVDKLGGSLNNKLAKELGEIENRIKINDKALEVSGASWGIYWKRIVEDYTKVRNAVFNVPIAGGAPVLTEFGGGSEISTQDPTIRVNNPATGQTESWRRSEWESRQRAMAEIQSFRLSQEKSAAESAQKAAAEIDKFAKELLEATKELDAFAKIARADERVARQRITFERAESGRLFSAPEFDFGGDGGRLYDSPKYGNQFTVDPQFTIDPAEMDEFTQSLIRAREEEQRLAQISLEATDAQAGFSAGLRDFTEQIGQAGDQMRTFALNISYGMANAFSSFFFDVMDNRIRTLKDGFVSLGRTIASVIQQASAQAAGTALAGVFAKSFAGGAVGGASGAGGAFSPPGPGSINAGPPLPTGGVSPFAMPAGGGGGSVNINLFAIDTQSGVQFLQKNASVIASIVAGVNKKTPGYSLQLQTV